MMNKMSIKIEGFQDLMGIYILTPDSCLLTSGFFRAFFCNNNVSYC